MILHLLVPICTQLHHLLFGRTLSRRQGIVKLPVKSIIGSKKLLPDYTLKTAHVSSSHSYQITIKDLMIMLPLHCQNTAALQHT